MGFIVLEIHYGAPKKRTVQDCLYYKAKDGLLLLSYWRFSCEVKIYQAVVQRRPMGKMVNVEAHKAYTCVLCTQSWRGRCTSMSGATRKSLYKFLWALRHSRLHPSLPFRPCNTVRSPYVPATSTFVAYLDSICFYPRTMLCEGERQSWQLVHETAIYVYIHIYMWQRVNDNQKWQRINKG